MTERRFTLVAVVATGLYTGPHNIIAYWAKRFARHGVRVVAIMPPDPGDGAPRMRAAGVDVRVMPFGRARRTPVHAFQFALRFVPDVLRLRRAFIDESCDAVAVIRSIDFAPAIAAKLAGKKLVWHLLDSAPPSWLRYIAGIAMRLLADEIPAMTPSIARMHGLGRCTRVHYIGPPSDDALFHRRIAAGAGFGPKDGRLVGVVAQLTAMKGIEHFIRAAARVSLHLPDARFVVVGGESAGHEAYAAMLRSEAARLGLRDRLWFAGARDDLPEVFAALDLLVIASQSRSEGLPTVMLNAMMSGTPVLATGVGGIPDVVEHGRTAWLVPPSDEGALADAMRTLLTDETLRRRLASNALREVAPKFRIDAWEADYMQVFGIAPAPEGTMAERASA